MPYDLVPRDAVRVNVLCCILPVLSLVGCGGGGSSARKAAPVILEAGVVASTNNPQVAQYTIQLPSAGSATIQFGTDTTYGLKTWSQSLSSAGQVTILVAGMRGNMTYHMQALVQLASGQTGSDVDHTFTTGAPTIQPALTVTTPTPGLFPSPGVEQLTTILNIPFGLVVTDLQGNVIWSYALPNERASNIIEGAKLLNNGHFLIDIDEGSGYPLDVPNGVSPPNTVLALQEIDLAGTIVRQLTLAQLNQALQGAGYALPLQQLHHDVEPLANGHWLVLANYLKSFTDLPGYPGSTRVLGDVVIDLDSNLKPVWVWDAFDHLDVTRHPWNFPDWTHSNAIVYSPTDGNLLVSMRHQNWVVKVDYRDGAGTGNVLWHLGYEGDFRLVNGVDPTDWPYAQHLPSFFTKSTSGVFQLAVMDNGDDRVFPTGVTCGADGAPACQYTTVPIFEIDETAKTARLIHHQILPPNLYSYFGGGTAMLSNGDIEYDLAGTLPFGSDVFETTNDAAASTVWHMHLTGDNAYRAFRIPSLYPGVQW